MTMYKDGDNFKTTRVTIELEFLTEDGFVPSLKDVAKMVKPFGELVGVRQISTNRWGAL